MRWYSKLCLVVILGLVVGGAFLAGTQFAVTEPEQPELQDVPRVVPLTVTKEVKSTGLPARPLLPALIPVQAATQVQHQAEQLAAIPTQLVNDPDVNLHYEVSKIGSSGLKALEVWITRDGGDTWRKFDEAKNPSVFKNGTFQCPLRLPEDGVYGIRLVVQSNAGLGKPPPRRGDRPELLVELDTVTPIGVLHKPVPDRHNANTLLLTWTAEDRNLGPQPICLQWATKAEGPWNGIAANLPNDGKYAWKLPPNLPANLYFRMIIRDEAGNFGVVVATEPALVDLSEPAARALSVSSAKQGARENAPAPGQFQR
jgi:hypothetical protein